MSFNLELKIVSELQSINSAVDVSDALDKVFQYKEDFIVVTIDDQKLNISLRYGFSDLLDDFLLILNDLDTMDEDDKYLFGFSQNDFFDGDWEFSLNNHNQLSINFIWRSTEHDDFPKTCTIDKTEFENKWKHILKEIKEYVSDITFQYDYQYDFITEYLK